MFEYHIWKCDSTAAGKGASSEVHGEKGNDPG